MIEKFEEFIKLAKKDIELAINYEHKSDDSSIVREIYKQLFDFYNSDKFGGDVIFTWKSPSHIINGEYNGDGWKNQRRTAKNSHVIGNLFPNHSSNIKFSLNVNRNGKYGAFPHDFIDIYLDHVAKYAYNFDRPNIKEYEPLKDAVCSSLNKKYFEIFKDFDDFLARNYLIEIWEHAQKKAYSDMEFAEFKRMSEVLMYNRGKLMVTKLLEKF